MDLFKKLLKKLGVFLILPLIFTCTVRVPVQRKEILEENQERFIEKDIIFNIVIDEAIDPGLALYRNATTTADVIDFYIELVGNEQVATAILHNAHDNDIPLNLAFAVAWVESSYNPWAINENTETKDRGLFQLNSMSFPDLTEAQVFDPYINSHHGLHYLNYCLNLGGNEIVALAIYNAGHGRVEYGGTPRSTLDHINRVLDYRANLDEKFYSWMNDKPSIQIAWNGTVVRAF